jgi:IS30 family transposase
MAAARRPTFARVFADPKLGLRRSAPALAKATGRSLADAREFLRSTDTAQAQKAWRRPPANSYSSTGGPSGEYQADTIFLAEFANVNGGRTAILTLIEATTRYVYARALTSATAKSAASALQSILDENAEDGAPIIRSLVIDGGG